MRAERLDAPELGLLDHPAGLLAPDLVGDALDDLARVRDIGPIADLDVEQRPRPVLRLVADAVDRAVRDVPHGPVDGAHARRAQADDLDDAGGLAEVDRVADAVLVLDEDEDARRGSRGRGSASRSRARRR